MASQKILTDLDLSGNKLLKLRIEQFATPPLSPDNGRVYYDTTLRAEMIFDGSSWKQANSVRTDPSVLGRGTVVDPFSVSPESIGIGEVDNTSDLDKPISRATQERLDLDDQGIDVRYVKAHSNRNSHNTGNHWCQIELILVDGTRVRGVAAITSTGVDAGVMLEPFGGSASYFAGVSGVADWVEIDFGVTRRVAAVFLRMYWINDRVYHSTKVEVSLDGTSYSTLHDSSIDGEYVQEKDGRAFWAGSAFAGKKNLGETLDHIRNKEEHLSKRDREAIEGVSVSDPFGVSLFPYEFSVFDYGSNDQPYGIARGNFSYLNGSINNNRAYLANGADIPSHKPGVVWECRANLSGGADGGFNSSYIEVDETKKYRISIWVRKPVSAAPLADGTVYFGTRAKNAAGSKLQTISSVTGGTTSNFYGFNSDLLTAGDWYLLIAYMHPSDIVAPLPKEGGVYRIGNTTKVAENSRDGVMIVGTRQLMIRSYLYYCSNADSTLDMFSPRIDLVNGSEPSVEDLMQQPTASLTSFSRDRVEAGIFWNPTTRALMYNDGINDYVIRSQVV